MAFASLGRRHLVDIKASNYISRITMRTTLTIDPDIAAQLDRLRKDREVSLKSLVNAALRAGLKQVAAAKKPEREQPFTTPVYLGQPLVNLDCVGVVLAELDAERFVDAHRRR